MLYIMLESIYRYGKLGDDIEILIYTSTPFMNHIQNSIYYKQFIQTYNIQFETNDTYNTIDKACKARLDLFYLKSTSKYDKILYLDTDIIIKKDIHPVFDLIQDDVIYVLEEGTIDDKREYWGYTLFKQDLENGIFNKETHDFSAFSSGIIGFKRCERIQSLFKQIKLDMIQRYHPFHDQPFFIYNAFKNNAYNNKLLKEYAINFSYDVNTDKIIHHFPSGPGIHAPKLNNMITFLKQLNDVNNRKNT
jgi:lipopolysaccharide biosynthesis glycosyltransferase